jgi:hypothetical protein
MDSYKKVVRDTPGNYFVDSHNRENLTRGRRSAGASIKVGPVLFALLFWGETETILISVSP